MGERLGKAAAAQHLAVDQHAVAVENDEVGLYHRLLSLISGEHIPKL
jgi:hypothetical protein